MPKTAFSRCHDVLLYYAFENAKHTFNVDRGMTSEQIALSTSNADLPQRKSTLPGPASASRQPRPCSIVTGHDEQKAKIDRSVRLARVRESRSSGQAR